MFQHRDPHNQEQPGVTVRFARADDGARILELVVALAHFEKLKPPDEAARERLLADAFRPDPKVEILLAESGSEVIGYAFFFMTYSTFLALPTLYLEDLFVLPEHRGRRAGYALMETLAHVALERGCGRMDWSVLDWNVNALEFYRRLGASHLSDWFIYRLDRAGLERLAAGER